MYGPCVDVGEALKRLNGSVKTSVMLLLSKSNVDEGLGTILDLKPRSAAYGFAAMLCLKELNVHDSPPAVLNLKTKSATYEFASPPGAFYVEIIRESTNGSLGMELDWTYPEGPHYRKIGPKVITKLFYKASA